MKKTILVLCVCLWTNVHIYAQKQIESNAEITSVTVYLQGAQLTSSAKATIPEGTSELLIRNLPVSLLQNTLQIVANADITIMSVSTQTNFISPKKEQEEVKRLQDSAEAVTQRIAKLDNRKSVLNGMSDILTKNIMVGGANNGVNTETLTKMYDIYNDKMTKIKDELLDISNKQNKLSTLLTDINKQVSEKNQNATKYFAEVVAQIQSKQSQQVSFKLTYIINDAGWIPEYDLRGESISKPLQLTYKASIWQNSGFAWDKVKLNVSTGNATVSATGPVLNPWYLNYFYGTMLKEQKQLESVVITSAPSAVRNKTKDEDAFNNTGANYTTVNNTQLAVVYDVEVSQSIPTNSKPIVFTLAQKEIEANYEYYCIPKLDPDAFLQARIINWEELNLLSGNANVFFEGAFVGQTYIDANQTVDTLNISLGRDKKVVVKRIKAKDYDRKKLIGDNYKRAVLYDISIRNLKGEKLFLMLYDQIPVSANSEIVVEMVDQGGADYQPETGKLTWKMELTPQQEKKLRFAFSVKYPKSKSVYAPRF